MLQKDSIDDRETFDGKMDEWDGLIGSWLLRGAAKWFVVCVVLLLLLFVSVLF